MISLIMNEEGTRHLSTCVLKRTIIVPHMDVFGILHSLHIRFSFLSFTKRFVRLFAIWQQDSKLFIYIVLAPYEYTLLYALNQNTSHLKLPYEHKHYKKIKILLIIFLCVKYKQMHVLLGDYAWSAKFCVLFMIIIN